MSQKLHLAKIILTNNTEPILNGALLTDGSQIMKVGKKEDFGDLSSPKYTIIDHGEALICPGFINLHTHLIYSKLQSLKFGARNLETNWNLFNWLENLVEETSKWEEKDYIESIQKGIKFALSTGTTFIVENTPSQISAQEISKSPLKALIGIEVFGSDEEKADKIFNTTVLNLSSLTTHHSPLIEFTLSPHAPYDVSKSLWKKLIEWSDINNKPLLTHLEESSDEKIWWQEKSGAGVKFWRKINKLDSKLKYWRKYNSGIDFLEKNNLLSKKIIATHLCHATNDDLISARNNDVKLVHCSRSNFYLNNGTANLKLWTEMGFLWGVGTDSIASNEDLDLLKEIRFVINKQDLIYNFKIRPKDAFEALTSVAAKILLKENSIGYLKPSYKADFLTYDIKNKSACTYKDPYYMLVWEINNDKDLQNVWINGKQAWLKEHLLHKI